MWELFPQFLAGPATRATLLWELVAPLVLLWPWRSKLPRTMIACGMIFFHLMIAFWMPLGMFPWLVIALWIAVLPIGEDRKQAADPRTWDWRSVLAAYLLLVSLSFAAEKFTKQSLLPDLITWPARAFKLNSEWAFYSDFSAERHEVRIEAINANPETPTPILDTEKEIYVSELPPISMARWERYLTAVMQPRFRYQLSGILLYLCRQRDQGQDRFEELRWVEIRHPIPGFRSADDQRSRRHVLSQIDCRKVN
jgi:hypothetical protein